MQFLFYEISQTKFFSEVIFRAAVGHDKNVPNLEVVGVPQACPTPPVFRVIL